MTSMNEQAFEDGSFEEVAPVPGALVPVVAPVTFVTRLPLPNSIFLTQVMASAEQLPPSRDQAEVHPVDPRSAYAACGKWRPAGFRTRQVI